VSSNHKEIIEMILKRHGLVKKFKEIQGAEVSYHKEHKLKNLMKRYHDAAYFVTDTRSDVVDGQKVPGLSVIAVSWGYNTWTGKEKVKPDIVVDDPEELLQVIG